MITKNSAQTLRKDYTKQKQTKKIKKYFYANPQQQMSTGPPFQIARFRPYFVILK